MPGSADLGERLEDYVSDLVRRGRFGSRADVLREGVRLLEQREKRAAVDAAVERGLADAEAGRVRPVAVVGERLGAKYAAMS